MMYKVVIFDWDGTLMDSEARIVSSMRLAAKNLGLEVPSSKAVKSIIGISLRPAIEQLFNVSCSDAIERIVTEYADQYVHRNPTPSPMFSGAVELLQRLSRDHLLAVATGKARRGLIRAMAESNTEHFFTASRCSDEAESKPSPDMLLQLLKELNVDQRQAVYVGDTVHDMAMANAINMDSIAVTYGVAVESELAAYQPTALVGSIEELGRRLLR